MLLRKRTPWNLTIPLQSCIKFGMRLVHLPGGSMKALVLHSPISLAALALCLICSFHQTALAAAGDLDTSFDGDGKNTTDFFNRTDIAQAVAVQPDGRIVVAGTIGGVGAVPTTFQISVSRATTRTARSISVSAAAARSTPTSTAGRIKPSPSPFSPTARSSSPA